MIDPLIWAFLCAVGVAASWGHMRADRFLEAIFYAGFAYGFVTEGKRSFDALLLAMDATAAGIDPPRFAQPLLIAAPLFYVLCWPSVMSIWRTLRDRREHA